VTGHLLLSVIGCGTYRHTCCVWSRLLRAHLLYQDCSAYSDRFNSGAVYEFTDVTHKLVILTETRYLLTLTYLLIAICIADEAAKSQSTHLLKHGRSRRCSGTAWSLVPEDCTARDASPSRRRRRRRRWSFGMPRPMPSVIADWHRPPISDSVRSNGCDQHLGHRQRQRRQ